MNPILVNVLRGRYVESRHRGAFAVVDAEGTLVAQAGDVDRPVYPRSAVKLLQALPLVASGAAARFGLDDAALSLACASHNGEPSHVDTAARVLTRAGLDASVLECGAHWPALDAAGRALAQTGAQPSALHNNCSGKHAGFVCLGCVLAGDAEPRAFLSGYSQPDHPVMREVSAALQAVTGFDLADAPRGIDGCSIPTHAIPLRRLALAFARIGTGVGLSSEHAAAARRLRTAIAHEPFMLAGTGRFDTRVVQQLGARVCLKVGAEGVYCAALPELGLGVAIKMDDGNNARAAEVAMASAIEALLPLDGDDASFMRSLSEPLLKNWNGIEVGQLEPTETLRRLSA